MRGTNHEMLDSKYEPTFGEFTIDHRLFPFVTVNYILLLLETIKIASEGIISAANN